MRASRILVAVVVLGLALTIAGVGAASAGCPPDSVRSGPVCMDKYEASVWYVPRSQTTLIGAIQKGTATLADLTGAAAAGVRQVGLTVTDALPYCPVTGNGCVDVYAVSVADGSKRWDFQSNEWFWSAPVVDGETVFTASLDGKVYALNTQDGSERWENPFSAGAEVRGALTMGASGLIVADRAGFVHQVDLESGEAIGEPILP